MDKLTLVIPAKYEKESLPQVLSELEKYQLNILIVLEETDVETIKSIKKFDCNILYQTRKGYGDALIQGIKNVKTDYFCIFNADGSFIPDELEGMINLIEKNYDLVFGSRYEKTLKVKMILLSLILEINFLHCWVNCSFYYLLQIFYTRTSLVKLIR